MKRFLAAVIATAVTFMIAVVVAFAIVNLFGELPNVPR